MIRHKIINKSNFDINNSVEGETIEQKVERITVNKEPITDSAPIIYQERKEGVLPGYDHRTDRWEVAREAMDKVQKSKIAKREERQKERENKSPGDEPIPGTE